MTSLFHRTARAVASKPQDTQLMQELMCLTAAANNCVDAYHKQAEVHFIGYVTQTTYYCDFKSASTLPGGLTRCSE
jgi:hypothetical protein